MAAPGTPLLVKSIKKVGDHLIWPLNRVIRVRVRVRVKVKVGVGVRL